MSVLIKNGRIVTADDDFLADIYIERTRIAEIAPDLNITAETVIDAGNRYVIPGGVDVHTHLDMPLGPVRSRDDFETGTRAAAFGGTTTIIDFATQSRGMRMREALDQWHAKAEGKACIDYGFHMIITDLSDMHLSEMDEMVKEGVSSFKLFMAYPGSLMVDDATILKAMRRAAEIGGMTCIHAEDGNGIEPLIKKNLSQGNLEPLYHALSRPPDMEVKAVKRAIDLARKANAPLYIVHVSSSGALGEIFSGRETGLRVFAETCPQYLFLSLDDIKKPDFEGAKYVFTPPVREKWHQEKLWGGLRDNSLQVVSTDHCPFNFRGDKELGLYDFTKIPNGGPGIENRMRLLFYYGVVQKRISLQRWVEILSSNPAKLFGLYPRKGTIGIGSDADIVVWDPSAEQTISAATHHMQVDYSLYEGMKVVGGPEIVLSNGKVLVKDGKWLGETGFGRYLRRNSSGKEK